MASQKASTSGWRSSAACTMPALHARAAAVDQSHLAKARRVRGDDVLLHDRRDVARGECVEIEGVFDGKVDGVVVLGHAATEN